MGALRLVREHLDRELAPWILSRPVRQDAKHTPSGIHSVTTIYGTTHRVGDLVTTRFGTFPIEAIETRSLGKKEKYHQAIAVFTDRKGVRRTSQIGAFDPRLEQSITAAGPAFASGAALDLSETKRFVSNLDRDAALRDLVDKSARIMHRENVQQLDRLRSIPGFDPQRLLGSDGPALYAFRERNVGLIRTISEKYLDDITATLEDPAVANLHTAGVRDLLAERFGVSESRAEFWAVDQCLKINAQITTARFVAAGIDRYVWTTSEDERVREFHRDLDGKTFTIGDPPVTSPEGDRNEPGEDYRCRCTKFPVFDVTPDEPAD